MTLITQYGRVYARVLSGVLVLSWSKVWSPLSRVSISLGVRRKEGKDISHAEIHTNTNAEKRSRARARQL